MQRRLQLTALAVCLAATAAGAEPAAPPPAALSLAADGRFAEAYAALTAAGADRDVEALQALARATLARGIDSDDVFERWAAMRAARRLAEPALAGPALRQLESDGRYEQALALEILATAAPRRSRAAFVTALDSPHRTVRLRALRALRDAEQREALVGRVAVLAGEDPDPDVRVVAVRTLREWNAFEAMPTLRRAVDDPVPAVRQEAVTALVRLGDAQVSDLVRARLAGAAPEDRARALRLAGLVPSRDLLPVVSPFLSDGDPEVRSAAAAAILAIAAGQPALP